MINWIFGGFGIVCFGITLYLWSFNKYGSDILGAIPLIIGIILIIIQILIWIF